MCREANFNSVTRPGDSQRPVIWGDYFNPDTRMILAALEVSGDTNYELIIINSLKREEHGDKYKQINPTGTIPTLIEGSYTMLGSSDLVILIYLCHTHDQVGKKLFPDD